MAFLLGGVLGAGLGWGRPPGKGELSWKGEKRSNSWDEA